MWIRIKDELINMSAVRYVGRSYHHDKFLLDFLKSDGRPTIYVPFDTEEEATDALNAIAEVLDIAVRFPPATENTE